MADFTTAPAQPTKEVQLASVPRPTLEHQEHPEIVPAQKTLADLQRASDTLHLKLGECSTLLDKMTGEKKKLQTAHVFRFVGDEDFQYLMGMIKSAPEKRAQLTKVQETFHQLFTNAAQGKEEPATVIKAAEVVGKAQDLIAGAVKTLKDDPSSQSAKACLQDIENAFQTLGKQPLAQFAASLEKVAAIHTT